MIGLNFCKVEDTLEEPESCITLRFGNQKVGIFRQRTNYIGKFYPSQTKFLAGYVLYSIIDLSNNSKDGREKEKLIKVLEGHWMSGFIVSSSQISVIQFNRDHVGSRGRAEGHILLYTLFSHPCLRAASFAVTLQAYQALNISYLSIYFTFIIYWILTQHTTITTR